MRKCFLVLTVFLSLLLTACPYRSTGVGLHYYNNTLTIFNSSSHGFRIVLNGEELKGWLPPGNHVTVDLWQGWGNYGVSHPVNVVIYIPPAEVERKAKVWTTQRTFFVSTYATKNDTWVVKDSDFGIW